MRGCARLIRFVLVVAFFTVCGVVAYFSYMNFPEVRDFLRQFDISIGTAEPGIPTPITDPTEIAALPTSIPPETPVPTVLPPTASACVQAASVEAGGEQVREERPSAPSVQADAQRRGRNVPRGRQTNVNAPRSRVPNRVIIEF